MKECRWSHWFRDACIVAPNKEVGTEVRPHFATDYTFARDGILSSRFSCGYFLIPQIIYIWTEFALFPLAWRQEFGVLLRHTVAMRGKMIVV